MEAKEFSAKKSKIISYPRRSDVIQSFSVKKFVTNLWYLTQVFAKDIREVNNSIMILEKIKKIEIVQILFFTLISLLLGRSIYLYFLDSPVRIFFFNQGLLQPYVESYLQLTWTQYTIHYSEKFALRADRFFFLSYFITLILCLSPIRKWKKTFFSILTYIFFVNLLYAYLKYVSSDGKAGLLLELSIQTITPVIYLLSVTKIKKYILMTLVAIAISFTFLGHGLFAWGYYPVPGYFIDMTLSFFTFMNESQAKLFLKIAAFIDFIIAAVAIIFIIIRFKSKAALNIILYYAVFWGFVTALARYNSYVSQYVDYMGIHIFIPQVLFRVPHWTFPLVLALYVLRLNNNRSKFQID